MMNIRKLALQAIEKILYKGAYANIVINEYLNKYDELLPELDNKKGILYLDSGNHFEIKK